MAQGQWLASGYPVAARLLAWHGARGKLEGARGDGIVRPFSSRSICTYATKGRLEGFRGAYCCAIANSKRGQIPLIPFVALGHAVIPAKAGIH